MNEAAFNFIGMDFSYIKKYIESCEHSISFWITEDNGVWELEIIKVDDKGLRSLKIARDHTGAVIVYEPIAKEKTKEKQVNL